MLEDEMIPTMIYDTKNSAVDIRDIKEEFISRGIEKNLTLILQVIGNGNRVYAYEQPFSRFLKKAHQVTKPEILTSQEGSDRFTLQSDNQNETIKLSLAEYVRKRDEIENYF